MSNFSNSSPAAMIETSNKLVKVVEGLLAFTHNDADYCPSCGQNYHSTIGKTCCDECGSTCNLQGGCGSDDCTNAPSGCEVGDHEYSSFNCPRCGHSCCWSCSVRCMDDSKGEGPFTCPSCGHGSHYPEVKEEAFQCRGGIDDHEHAVYCGCAHQQ